MRNLWPRLTVASVLATGLCIGLPACDAHHGHDHGAHDEGAHDEGTHDHDGDQHDTTEQPGHDHDGGDHDGHEHGGGDQAGHDHSDFVRHGGTLHEVGDHAALLEVVFDHAGKRLSVYVMDADGAALTPDATPVLNLLHDGTPAQVTGTPEHGAWTFAHDSLGGDPEKALLRLTVDGKSHSVALTHGHDDHGHDH